MFDNKNSSIKYSFSVSIECETFWWRLHSHEIYQRKDEFQSMLPFLSHTIPHAITYIGLVRTHIKLGCLLVVHCVTILYAIHSLLLVVCIVSQTSSSYVYRAQFTILFLSTVQSIHSLYSPRKMNTYNSYDLNGVSYSIAHNESWIVEAKESEVFKVTRRRKFIRKKSKNFFIFWVFCSFNI